MNKPPVCEYDPKPAVLRWMNNKDRRVKKRSKSNKARLVEKIFCHDFEHLLDGESNMSKVFKNFYVQKHSANFRRFDFTF